MVIFDYKALGKKLKQERIAKRVPQTYVSKQTGIHNTYISKIERGEEPINTEKLSRLCNYYGVSMYDYMGEKVVYTDAPIFPELITLLQNCPEEKRKLIYNVCKAIIDTD